MDPEVASSVADTEAHSHTTADTEISYLQKIKNFPTKLQFSLCFS